MKNAPNVSASFITPDFAPVKHLRETIAGIESNPLMKSVIRYQVEALFDEGLEKLRHCPYPDQVSVALAAEVESAIPHVEGQALEYVTKTAQMLRNILSSESDQTVSMAG